MFPYSRGDGTMESVGSGAPTGLAERVKGILLTPKTEWPVIDAEPSSIGDIYRGYVVPLAAVPAVCAALGGVLWGHSLLGITYRPSIASALVGAVTSFLLTLIGVYLLALVIDALAPTFAATRDRTRAFKLAAYSGTAAWVAGLFQLVPGLGWLSILGIYGLYLLYIGLPVLMRAPQDKAMPYTAATILAAIVLSIVVGLLTAPLVALVSGPATIADSGSVSGNLTVPGVGSVDLGKLEQAGKQMEAAAKKAEAGGTVALAPAALQALLPDGIDAFRREEVSSSGASAGGMGGSQAEAIYRNGASNITLGITDMGAAGALAALGTALNVQSNKETAEGYEKVNQIDGRMVSEEWNASDRQGKYSVLVGNRFMVAAEGDGVDVAELRKSVEAVGFARLEALAK